MKTTRVLTWCAFAGAFAFVLLAGCATPGKPREQVPPEFRVTELISNDLPRAIEFWTTAFCPGAGTAMEYKIPPAYRIESCTPGPMGSHGGCVYCAMSRIRLVQGESAIPFEAGVCGSAVQQTGSYRPTGGLCDQGTPTGMDSYASQLGGSKWCWSCGRGSGKVSCCGKE